MRNVWGSKKGIPKADEREILVSEPKVLETVDNRIYFYAEVDRETVLTLNKNLRGKYNDFLVRRQTEGTEEVTPIYLHLQSFGGSVFAGLSAMDAILQLRHKVPIHTVVDGCTASAATFVSVVGTKRYINQNAFMLIHQLSSMMWGKYSEIQDEMENMERLMKKIKEIYTTYTKLPENKLDSILEHDLWIDAKQCLKYGLVDEILKV